MLGTSNQSNGFAIVLEVLRIGGIQGDCCRHCALNSRCRERRGDCKATEFTQGNSHVDHTVFNLDGRSFEENLEQHDSSVNL